jgi:hypothetical protein
MDYFSETILILICRIMFPSVRSDFHQVSRRRWSQPT